MQTLLRLLFWLPTLIGTQPVILGCDVGPDGNALRTDPTRQAERDRMVDGQIIARGVRDPAVLAAIRRVPRHLFASAESARAYDDIPVPIGYDQTISQPCIVAFMIESLGLQGHEKVLEIGTGSGYQSAVLAEIVPEVFTIEIIEPLAKQAAATLTALGYRNVHVRAADGYDGWPEEAPFDAIILTAAHGRVPEPLLAQLAVGGRLILPIGEVNQRLVLIRRTEDGYERTELVFVRFVPMRSKVKNNAPPYGYELRTH